VFLTFKISTPHVVNCWRR